MWLHWILPLHRRIKMSKIPDWIDDGEYSEGSLDDPKFKEIQARHHALIPKRRVIIAGGRDYHNYDTVLEAIEESGLQIDVVVSGGANGVDALGERYAVEMNLPLAVFMADWQTHGRAAGPIRNRKMAENADALIAVWDGQSRGTKNMIETATKRGLLVYVKRV